MRACRLAALDYTKISRLDPVSLIKEKLILADLERDLTVQHCYAISAFYGAMQTPEAFERGRSALNSALSLAFPWSAKKDLDADKPNFDKMVELYNKVIGKKNS